MIPPAVPPYTTRSEVVCAETKPRRRAGERTRARQHASRYDVPAGLKQAGLPPAGTLNTITQEQSQSIVGTRSRKQSVDVLRGIVMVIMALDHTRDFFHRDAAAFSPTDLGKTTAALFFTRWITHFCAPTFMFLAGAGAYFWWKRQHTKRDLSRYLLTRGLWLMLLEITLMRLAYNFNLSFRYPFLLVVFWVIGGCMVGMAAVVWLPMRWLAVLSIATIVVHNCFDRIQAAQLGAGAWIWNVLHQPGAFSIAGIVVIIAYPLVPWIAVMAAGFCFGGVLQQEEGRRRAVTRRIGLALTIGFVLVRALNVYGDPVPWSVQKSGLFTILSFLNATKYPPSLDFLLMTLGPALLLLAYLDGRRFAPDNPLVVFGRVPLFYFVVHFYAIHVLVVLMALVRYGTDALQFVFNPVPSMGGPAALFPPQFGYPLWVVYVMWALIVVALYPLCRWYAAIKSSGRSWWLSYL